MPNYRRLEKEGDWVPVMIEGGRHSYIYDSHQELLGVLINLEEIAGIFIDTRRTDVDRHYPGYWAREYRATVRKLSGTKTSRKEGFSTVRAAVSWALDTLINGEVKE